MELIRLENVKKIYQTGEVITKAVDGIDFTVDQGEFALIIGASGAGKTTVLNILGGMDTATSGAVYIDGEDISKWNKKQRPRAIHNVFPLTLPIPSICGNALSSSFQRGSKNLLPSPMASVQFRYNADKGKNCLRILFSKRKTPGKAPRRPSLP